MSSVHDPIEAELKKLTEWTNDDLLAPPGLRRVFFEETTWRYLRRFSDRVPKGYSADRGETKTAGEQVSLLLGRFVAGKPLVIDSDLNFFRSSEPPFVWELCTIDVRLFGGFVKPDCLIICATGLADLLHDEKNLSHTHRKAVDRVIQTFRSKLPLPLRNPIEGSNPHAVLSNVNR